MDREHVAVTVIESARVESVRVYDDHGKLHRVAPLRVVQVDEDLDRLFVEVLKPTAVVQDVSMSER
jgi:hypothetical protein